MSTTALVRSQSGNLARTSSQYTGLSRHTSSDVSSSTNDPTPKKLPTLDLTPLKDAAKTAANKLTTPSQQASPALSVSSTPGQWRHPRMDEVVRRQNANSFDAGNMRIIVFHIALIAASFILPQYVLPNVLTMLVDPFYTYILWLLRAFCATCIGHALLPLALKQDACEDIPLTPQQRQMLSLPPMSRPVTPQEQEQYVTPPRYSRSATPNSGSSARSLSDSLRVARGSPLSGRGSPLDASLRIEGSPFGSSQRPGSDSPYSQSPLAAPRLRSAVRRQSSGSPRASPLDIKEFEAAGSAANPAKSNRASVGLNSKWLYERGRGSPRASPGISGWGTGSVFN